MRVGALFGEDYGLSKCKPSLHKLVELKFFFSLGIKRNTDSVILCFRKATKIYKRVNPLFWRMKRAECGEFA